MKLVLIAIIVMSEVVLQVTNRAIDLGDFVHRPFVMNMAMLKQAQLVILLSLLTYNDTHRINKRIYGVDYMITGVDGIPGVYVENGVLPVQKGCESFNLLELRLAPDKKPVELGAKRIRLKDWHESDETLTRHFQLTVSCAETKSCRIHPGQAKPPDSLTVDEEK